MADTDIAVALAYLELASELALKAANTASACAGALADKIEETGDRVHADIDRSLGLK